MRRGVSIAVSLIVLLSVFAQVQAAQPVEQDSPDIHHKDTSPMLEQQGSDPSNLEMNVHQLTPTPNHPNLLNQDSLLDKDKSRHPLWIFGIDNRQRLSPASPRVAHVGIGWEDGTVGLCSAAFVGPRVLLTAAHCLYDHSLGGFAEAAVVAPGQDGNATPYGTQPAVSMTVPRGWSEGNPNSNDIYLYDYGLLVLDSTETGNATGWFEMGVLPTSSLEAPDFGPFTVGYPGDKPTGTQWITSESAFDHVGDYFLYHQMDQYFGQSGSPVMRSEDAAIVGVASGDVTLSDGSRTNAAVRLTTPILEGLSEACNDLDCSLAYFIEEESTSPTPTPTQPQSTATPTQPQPTATPSPTQAPPQPSPSPSPTVPPDEPAPPTPTPPEDSTGDTNAFDRTWERTDQPVASGAANRTWMWGPEPFTDVLTEPYAEAPDGQRQVIYYDKSRMEITDPGEDPSDPWYVTNGLLVKELVTGRIQMGESTFEDHQPAEVNAAGDPNDPNGPTYATFNSLLDTEPRSEGTEISQVIDREGNVTDEPGLANFGVTAGRYVEQTDHTVASVFWDFMNSWGTVYENGEMTTGDLFENPFYATGYPITEAYWAGVQVGGELKWVLIQAFQRRVLTYTPDNSPGWKVEAGNVGRHYHTWRYEQIPDDDEPSPDPPSPDPSPPDDGVPDEGEVIAQGTLEDWEDYEYEVGETFVENGTYHIRVDEPDYFIPAGTTSTYGNVSVSLDVRMVTSTDTGEACLLTRLDPSGDYNHAYALCVWRENGNTVAYAEYETPDESGQIGGDILIESEQHSAANPLDQWNTLKIISKGNQFWFLVNGTVIGTATHDGPTEGAVGMKAGNFGSDADGPVEYEFTNLVIREVQ